MVVSIRALLSVGLLWVFGKLLALGKDLLIAYYFGASLQTDAYFIASNISGLIYAGLLATVPMILVPAYSVKIASAGLAKANTYASTVLNWYLLVTMIMAVAVFVFAKQFVSLLAPGVESSVFTLAVSLTRIFTITFAFTMISAVLTSVQLVHRQSVGSQLIPVLNNSIFIIGVIVFAPAFGIYAAAVAATLAWLLQFPIQAFLVRHVFNYSLNWQLDHATAKMLLLAFVPAFISASIEQLTPIISVHFASTLEGGSISLLTYSMRVISLFSGLFIVITSTISYPEYARKVANFDHVGLFSHISNNLKLVFLLSALLAVLANVFSSDIVKLLYQRGRFSASDAVLAAMVLSWLSIGIPFIAVREIYLRAIYSLSKPFLAMMIGATALVVNIAICMYAVDSKGLLAVVIGSVLASAISCILGCFALHKLLHQKIKLTDLMSFARMTLLFVIIWWGLHILSSVITAAHPLVRIAIGSVSAMIASLVGLYFIGESNFLMSIAQRIGIKSYQKSDAKD